MNVGILCPSSKAHAGISVEFLGGLKAFLKSQELDKEVKIISESVGLGGAEKEVYQKAEKLLVFEDVDILVAYIDLRVLPFLEPLFFTSGKLIIVVNPGANYPVNWIPQPNILFLTLNHAFLCRLTGKLAAQSEDSRCAVVSTFYDCGYLHSAAMVGRYMKSGGTVGFNYINNQRYDDQFNIKELADYLARDQKAHELLCICDETPASLLYDRLNALEAAEHLHLFVSPMMLQPVALAQLDKGYNFPIDGYLPWHISSSSSSNHTFLELVKLQTRKEPGIFSILGWETGMILQHAALNAADHIIDGTKIVEGLAGIKMESPRGELILDQQTNYFLAPFMKASIKKNTNKLELEETEIPEDEWRSYTALPNNGVSSGWTNTYLCY